MAKGVVLSARDQCPHLLQGIVWILEACWGDGGQPTLLGINTAELCEALLLQVV